MGERSKTERRRRAVGEDGQRVTVTVAGRVPAMQIEQASSGSYGGRGAEPGIARPEI